MRYDLLSSFPLFPLPFVKIGIVKRLGLPLFPLHGERKEMSVFSLFSGNGDLIKRVLEEDPTVRDPFSSFFFPKM